MIQAGIIGATGYAGVELVRLLLRHPQVELAAVSSGSFEGQPLAEVYPNLNEITPLVCEAADEVIRKSDVVFAALPHGLSQDTAAAGAAQGKKFIDLGADFRLDDPQAYTTWYGCEAKYPELHAQAVYGLCELFRDDIRKTSIIGNPGCYPTSVALGLAPALRQGLVSPTGIVVDSKSGTTGAGRKPTQTTHFPDCNEAFSAYKVAAHRHTPEMEQTLSKAAGAPVKLTFVPHLLPVNRGILATCYARLKDGVTMEDLLRVYHERYDGEYFVRLLPQGRVADIKNVWYSNFCDVSLHMDPRTNTFVAISAIDNMVKGAAGQAVQNMNLAFGLDETEGLRLFPPAF